MQTCKAHIPLEIAFVLATQRKRNWHKQHEIYMASASSQAARWVHKASPLVRKVLRWVCQASLWLFGYQHVGCDGGVNQHDGPMRVVTQCSGI